MDSATPLPDPQSDGLRRHQLTEAPQRPPSSPCAKSQGPGNEWILRRRFPTRRVTGLDDISSQKLRSAPPRHPARSRRAQTPTWILRCRFATRRMTSLDDINSQKLRSAPTSSPSAKSQSPRTKMDSAMPLRDRQNDRFRRHQLTEAPQRALSSPCAKSQGLCNERRWPLSHRLSHRR